MNLGTEKKTESYILDIMHYILVDNFVLSYFFNSIIPTAFFATTLIFVCFTLSALWAEERTYLYLGGMAFVVFSVGFKVHVLHVILYFRALSRSVSGVKNDVDVYSRRVCDCIS